MINSVKNIIPESVSGVTKLSSPHLNSLHKYLIVPDSFFTSTVEVNLLVNYLESNFFLFKVLIDFFWLRALRIAIHFCLVITFKELKKDVSRIKEIEGAVSGALEVQVFVVYHTVLVSTAE